MDLYLLLFALFGTFSFILSAGLAAPTAHPLGLLTPHSNSGHVRTKRCSCATFLDKECVYFCHLDIIWVNTPERVVSYGLGNAPRTKRSVLGSERRTSSRCMCLKREDQICDNFCQPQIQQHREKLEKIPSVHCQECSSSECSSSECSSGECQLNLPLNSAQSGPELRAVVRSQTILEKWRTRRRDRSRHQKLNLLKT
ncbi:hypothetical protein NQD34_018175 [Periophthalmus magnuspinnatus]|uniref:endothelin-1 n=1 Tax=Periophthalmus magnuspinnatus TaxID=409849 RepID=UPI0022BC891C|nr:endothelin-1 [Periophthalmus magnuspinnatus]KAJ0003135.1 hypothetical protein NQD34_018175 [Periophthalmus magnuspinnatus]